jgi:hypothetical protein
LSTLLNSKAPLSHDASGDTDNRAIVRDILNNHCVCPNLDIITDKYVTKDFRTASHSDIITQSRATIAFRGSNRNLLINPATSANPPSSDYGANPVL